MGSKLWRSLVLAAAMLGSTLAVADTARLARAKLEREVNARAINATVKAAVTAQSTADRAAAKARLEQLRGERAAIDARIAALEAPFLAAATLEAHLAALDKKLASTTVAIAEAKSAADREAATASLSKLQAEREWLTKQLAAERAKTDRMLTEVERLERDLRDLTPELDLAILTLTNARTQTKRETAKAKLESLKKTKAALEAKLAVAKQAPHPGP